MPSLAQSMTNFDIFVSTPIGRPPLLEQSLVTWFGQMQSFDDVLRLAQSIFRVK